MKIVLTNVYKCRKYYKKPNKEGHQNGSSGLIDLKVLSPLNCYKLITQLKYTLVYFEIIYICIYIAICILIFISQSLQVIHHHHQYKLNINQLKTTNTIHNPKFVYEF